MPKEYLTSFKLLFRYEKCELLKKFGLYVRGPDTNNKNIHTLSFIQNQDFLETFLNSSVDEGNRNEKDTIKSKMAKAKCYNVSLCIKKDMKISAKNRTHKNKTEILEKNKLNELDIDEDFDIDEEVTVNKLPDSFTSKSLKILDMVSSVDRSNKDDNTSMFIQENRHSFTKPVSKPFFNENNPNRNTEINPRSRMFAEDKKFANSIRRSLKSINRLPNTQ